MHLYGPSIWEVMVVGVTLPKNGVPSTEQAQDYFRNAQAMRVITSSPCAQEFNKIRNVEIAKKIWDTQRGTDGSQGGQDGFVVRRARQRRGQDRESLHLGYVASSSKGWWGGSHHHHPPSPTHQTKWSRAPATGNWSNPRWRKDLEKTPKHPRSPSGGDSE